MTQCDHRDKRGQCRAHDSRVQLRGETKRPLCEVHDRLEREAVARLLRKIKKEKK